MFSFLTFLSEGLNYFNFFNIGSRGNRILNQVYVVAGILGDLYLLYAGWRFMVNGFIIHGMLITIASVFLVYFLYINFYYYFLKRQAPGDVSPQIEKKLGLRQFNERADRSLDRIQNVPEGRNRELDRQIRQSIPVRLDGDDLTRRNLRALVQDLLKGDNLQTDYAGLNSRQLYHRLKSNHHEPVYAIGAGALLPVYHLRQINGEWRVFAGNDEAHERYVGKIARVGLQNIQDVNARLTNWTLQLTSVVLVGGRYQILGRSGVYRGRSPYRLQVSVKFNIKERPRG